MFEKRKAILREALKCKDLKKLDKRDFLKVWRTIFFLQNGLHPDEYKNPEGGWPERLKPLAREAFRRAKTGEFADDEIYCYREVLKGIKARCKSK
jgi:hypothetical protein